MTVTTDNPTSDTNLAWIGPCETSRVVAIQLGHGHSAFGHPSCASMVNITSFSTTTFIPMARAVEATC